MKVTLEKQKDNVSKISLETEPGRAKDQYKKTVREFAKYVNIPGFRKGKAPIKMIEEQVGVEQIKSEAMNLNFLSELLYEAFQKEKIEVMSIPSIDKLEFDDPEGPVKLEATIEFFPEVKLGKYKGLKADVEIPLFKKDEYVKDTLDKIAKQYSSFEEADKAVELGDEIVFDFEGRLKESGETLDSLKATEYQAIIEPGRFIPGFAEQIAGMKKDEEKEIDVTFPEDYHSDDVKGKDAVFKIKVHKVSGQVVPAIDDELAKKVNSENLADLEKRVIEEMEKLQEQNKKMATSEALLKIIIDDSEVQISDFMVQREIESSLERVKKQYQMDDNQWKDFLEHMNKEEEGELAKERLKKSLIISEIIKVEELKVEDDEIENKLKEVFPQLPPGLKTADMEEVMSKMKLDMLTDKAFDFVADAADLKYIEIKEGEETKAKKTTKKKSTAKKSTAKKDKEEKAKDDKSEDKPKKKKAAAKKKD